MRNFSTSSIVFTLFAVLSGGTVFFRFVEGWGWIDSYFFTVVTISTVGYGNLVPATALGKIGTTVLIFGGLGVFALAVQKFANYQIEKREQHSERLFGGISPPANDDDRPEGMPQDLADGRGADKPLGDSQPRT